MDYRFGPPFSYNIILLIWENFYIWASSPTLDYHRKLKSLRISEIFSWNSDTLLRRIDWTNKMLWNSKGSSTMFFDIYWEIYSESYLFINFKPFFSSNGNNIYNNHPVSMTCYHYKTEYILYLDVIIWC